MKKTGKKKNKKEQESLMSDEEFLNLSGNNNDQNNKFPGYPHYPPKEDIMNPRNDMEKTELNEEEFSQKEIATKNHAKSGINKSSDADKKASVDEEGDEEPEDINPETDVTREELKILDAGELNMDGGDDELLRKRTMPVDMAGEDLDIPGSELDDENEIIGEEDEENNNYSIGGDRHEDLEESKG